MARLFLWLGQVLHRHSFQPLSSEILNLINDLTSLNIANQDHDSV